MFLFYISLEYLGQSHLPGISKSLFSFFLSQKGKNIVRKVNIALLYLTQFPIHLFPFSDVLEEVNTWSYLSTKK